MFFFYDDKGREADMLSVLNDLIENWENEVVEFKEAGKDYDKDKIGKYFSAISNEANLKGFQFGWLVFGVKNKTREIVGSDYRNTKGLDLLKQEIAVGTTGGITFIDIIEIYPVISGEEKRVIMFQIPAAATAIPTGWHDHFYGRNGESLSALSVEELDRLRGQEKKDWSKQLIEGASAQCLNRAALKMAREKYIEKMNRPHITEEVERMTDEEFLVKLKLMQNGKLTNAAMLLLGDEDYDYFFASVPEASWRLFNHKNDIQDYEIFKIPFLTLSDRIFSRIRNLTYRYMPNQLTLFPTETKQYDMWLLRELMNNCIVHSDYTLGGRIYLNEFEDEMIMTNPGTFLPGSVEPILKASYNPPFYRNQLLAETMVKLNMIDTQTMGIRRVFRIQQEKYFPLPDYDLSAQRQVGVKVYGKALNENYTQVLFQNPDFDLTTVYLMDRVQKHEPISKEAVKYLRKLKVIEGKLPNIYISASLAANVEEKAQYVKNKGFDEDAYKRWIIKYLEEYGSGKKKDFVILLKDKLPDTMNDKQKLIKVQNLLQAMRKDGVIILDSDNLRAGNWILVKSNS